jgi:hypothetical protein
LSKAASARVPVPFKKYAFDNSESSTITREGNSEENLEADGAIGSDAVGASLLVEFEFVLLLLKSSSSDLVSESLQFPLKQHPILYS